MAEKWLEIVVKLLFSCLKFWRPASNCICFTIFLMRCMSGSLHSGIAVFEVFIVNIYISWGFLVLAEISVMKALLIYKFSWIVGIEENFAGRFLLKFNLGYSLISQTARLVHKFYSDTFFYQVNFFHKTFFSITDTFLDPFLMQCIFSF